MARGNNNNNNRGRGQGSPSPRGNSQGRGQGRRRGWGRGRGRGRGHYPNDGSPGGSYPHGEMDSVVQIWQEPQNNFSRGGGRGGPSGSGTPQRGGSTPRRGMGRGRGRGGGGYDTPRGRPGFGANRNGNPPRGFSSDVPLSKLLDRPHFKPITFVRSVHTRTLFEEVEDILQPVVESAGASEESHVPTANRVTRVFSGNDFPPPSSASSEDGHSEGELEELDFADMGKLRDRLDAVHTLADAQASAVSSAPCEEIFTGMYNNRNDHDGTPSPHHPEVTPEKPDIVFTDTVVNETTVTSVHEHIVTTLENSTAILVITEDDAIVVEKSDTIPVSPSPIAPISNEIPTSSTGPTEGEAPSLYMETVPTRPSEDDEINVEKPETILVSSSPQAPISNEIPTSPAGLTEDDAPAFYIDTEPTRSSKDDEIVIEEPETILVSSSPKAPILDSASPASPTEDVAPTFYIDIEPARPSAHRSAGDAVLFDRTRNGTLGEEDELIVYVAPHPRSGRASPIPDVPRVRLPSRSLLTGTTNPAQNQTLSGSIAPEDALDDKSFPTGPSDPPQFSTVSFDFTSPSAKRQPRHRPVFTPGDRSKAKVQARKREARAARKRVQSQAMFGSFGAMLSEARLRDADELERRDVRWESRRQDDSDIDWGDDAEVPGNDGVDEVSNGLGGMDLDPDLEPNLEAMKGFVKSMSAEGSRHVTMDDLEDEELMRIEDEEEDDDNDSHDNPSDTSDDEDDEEKAVFEVEEEILIAESQGERLRGPSPSESSDEGEDSSDDELSPRGSFQARLRRVREKSRATQPTTEVPGDEDLSDTSFPRWSRANADDDYIAHIDDLLEKHSDMDGSKNQKLRKQLFRAIQDGQFDDYDDYIELNGSFSYEDMEPAKRKKDKIKGLPAELQAAWEKDRAKKAEFKQARAMARILAAADPLTSKKGGKKGRKAMRAAANLDPSVLAEYPNAIVDMVSLEKQIRRFVDDIGIKNDMVLPPMDKASRKRVHEIANAFNLKSQSKGKGSGRYTTLIKTTRTSSVDEGKVRKIMKRFDGGFNRPHDGKSRAGMPKHKDGDEVGKAAPKIGETNIGFKMLASMGWAEGDRIGGDASTGIDAPLTAIIKNTKLGLGATR